MVSYLQVEGLVKSFGDRVLFENLSLGVGEGQRIGLIAKNGTGKTTLLNIIAGREDYEAGRITFRRDLKVAYLEQNPAFPEGTTVLDACFLADSPALRAVAAYEQAVASADEDVLHRAMAEMDAQDAWNYESRVKQILTQLKIKDFDQPTGQLSGGQVKRVALANALIAEPDLLILDEPTNHLDLDSVIWLEAWLKRVQATIIIISHDREFLDRAVGTIWSIEDGTIRRYAGNYSDFEAMRIERLRQQEAGARAYERTASHLQAFIDRFRYKATKARQAQSRIKMLEKLQAVEPVRAKAEWRFEFPEPERLPDHLLDAENMSLGYGDTPVLQDVSFCVRSGERIGVLGVNGAGKSTLVKGICGELPLMSGTLRRGQGLTIGYFAQHQLDSLRLDETPLQHLRRMAPDTREQELRDFLGKFRFSGDQVNELVAPMSGGEKARLALALIAWEKPNLLVLDEPTNHLDMETREALTIALSTFGGSVLIVSHDRHLLRAATETLWLVRGGHVSAYDGDLDDYAELVLSDRRDRAAAQKEENRSAAAPVVTQKEARREAAKERARIASLRKPVQKKIDAAEKRMAEIDARAAELDAQIADPAFYSGEKAQVEETLKERSALTEEKETLEAEWLELSEELESIK